MAFHGQQKQDLIGRFRTHDKDTGSPEVQVALITNRITGLKEHFDRHKKDHSSRRGLIKLVGERRRLLRYLHKTHKDRYLKLIEELGLRK